MTLSEAVAALKAARAASMQAARRKDDLYAVAKKAKHESDVAMQDWLDAVANVEKAEHELAIAALGEP